MCQPLATSALQKNYPRKATILWSISDGQEDNAGVNPIIIAEPAVY
jgi:hypothetical protein